MRKIDSGIPIYQGGIDTSILTPFQVFVDNMNREDLDEVDDSKTFQWNKDDAILELETSYYLKLDSLFLIRHLVDYISGLKLIRPLVKQY